MKDEIITYKDRRYGLIFRRATFSPGAEWVSQAEDNIQVGFFNYNATKHLRSHKHNIYERIATRSCEAMYVISGSLLITMLDEEGSRLGQYKLEAGDVYISLMGGHFFDILEDGTKIFEVKNGPFFGVERDKTWFEPA